MSDARADASARRGARVDFYFDYLSPYAYFSALRLPALCARRGAELVWHPVLFAGLLDHWGHRGPAEIPPKALYTFRDSARFLVWIGALGAAGAALLGWCAGGFHLVDSDWVETTHRWLGTSTALWAWIVVGLNAASHRPPRADWRMAYLALLFLGTALVGATGFFGASLVYGLDHLAW